jgi:ABC-type transporter Mla subunit MlaD
MVPFLLAQLQPPAPVAAPAPGLSPEASVIVYTVVAAIVAQAFTFVTMVWKDRSQRIRDRQARADELEDRKALAQQVIDTSDKLASKVHDTSEKLATKVIDTSLVLAQTVNDTSIKLAEKVVETTAAITEAIAANTALTREAKDAAREAYTEANNVNLKIAEIGLQVKENLHSSKPS